MRGRTNQLASRVGSVPRTYERVYDTEGYRILRSRIELVGHPPLRACLSKLFDATVAEDLPLPRQGASGPDAESTTPTFRLNRGGGGRRGKGRRGGGMGAGKGGGRRKPTVGVAAETGPSATATT